MPDQTVLFLALVGLAVAINLLTFALFGLDKRRSRRGAWRMSERRLLTCALLGGSVGAKIGQRVFRHKTSKQPFAGLLNAICFLQVVAAGAMALPASRQSPVDIGRAAGGHGLIPARPAGRSQPAPRPCQLRCSLKKAMVRSHASSAAASS
ncbi:DUF1294 domain-containing protein [Antarctobacter sp.]|uniref:DUF1294 domain-containing protein n=1 Tax=Antarctobacter sp. TaxID=1872577 RepID=UPI003A8D0461